MTSCFATSETANRTELAALGLSFGSGSAVSDWILLSNDASAATFKSSSTQAEVNLAFIVERDIAEVNLTVLRPVTTAFAAR